MKVKENNKKDIMKNKKKRVWSYINNKIKREKTEKKEVKKRKYKIIRTN